MFIPSSIGGALDARREDTGLQFVVGQDETGRWVAVESHGRGGGIFINRKSALNYAAFEAGQRTDAVPCSSEPLGLWKRVDAQAFRGNGRR
ncbi:MAG: hypothetical protein WAK03_03770 [Methylocystis sp.]|jgi:hypothetical protein